jgi:hypothetical protein
MIITFFSYESGAKHTGVDAQTLTQAPTQRLDPATPRAPSVHGAAAPFRAWRGFRGKAPRDFPPKARDAPVTPRDRVS